MGRGWQGQRCGNPVAACGSSIVRNGTPCNPRGFSTTDLSASLVCLWLRSLDARCGSPRLEQEALWACEESLRCKAVAVVWATVEYLTGIAFRRLQLAAEESGGIGFLVRSATALKQPSWADVRLSVTPRPARGENPCFHVAVAYSRGQTMRSVADIEINALRGTLHEAVGKSQTYRVSAVS